MNKVNLLFIVIFLILCSIPCVSADVSQWIHIAFDKPVEWIQIHPQDTSLIYVNISREGILKTSDGGFNWQKVTFKKADPFDPEKVI